MARTAASTGKGSSARRPAGGSRKVAGDKKAARATRRAGRRDRLRQLRAAFTMTREADPRLVVLLVLAFAVPFVLLLSVGLVVGHPFLLGFTGAFVGLIALTIVFGRRAQRTAFGRVEGQAGAAAAVLENMRGDWRVTPAVGFTREQDMVHRVVGRAGIVLVGEGSPGRTRGLVVTEKKRLARFIGETPVYDVLVGDGDGQVPLRGLEKHFLKLPKNIKGKEVNILTRKLSAMAPALPIPKGPVPMGGRMPRGRAR